VTELAEPQVIIVGAVCEKCGEILGIPDDPKPVPAVGIQIQLYTYCGGQLILATEPAGAEGTLEAVVRLGNHMEACEGLVGALEDE
jgi:hypothetical protein